MKLKINQTPTFSDLEAEVPSTIFDKINTIIDWEPISTLLKSISTDYAPLSLFKALLIQTWYNMSDEQLADSLHRDIAFMKFCSFSLSSHKPDASTISRFRSRISLENPELWHKLLSCVNESLARSGIEVSSGCIADATLVQSSRRPKKFYKVEKDLSPEATEYQVTQKSRPLH